MLGHPAYICYVFCHSYLMVSITEYKCWALEPVTLDRTLIWRLADSKMDGIAIRENPSENQRKKYNLEGLEAWILELHYQNLYQSKLEGKIKEFEIMLLGTWIILVRGMRMGTWYATYPKYRNARSRLI